MKGARENVWQCVWAVGGNEATTLEIGMAGRVGAFTPCRLEPKPCLRARWCAVSAEAMTLTCCSYKSWSLSASMCWKKRIGNHLAFALTKSRWRIRAWRAAEDPAVPADSRNTALSPVGSGPPRAARITRMPASSSPPRLHWQGLSTPHRRHLDDTTSPAAGHCSRPSSPARPIHHGRPTTRPELAVQRSHQRMPPLAPTSLTAMSDPDADHPPPLSPGVQQCQPDLQRRGPGAVSVSLALPANRCPQYAVSSPSDSSVTRR